MHIGRFEYDAQFYDSFFYLIYLIGLLNAEFKIVDTVWAPPDPDLKEKKYYEEKSLNSDPYQQLPFLVHKYI